MSDAANIWLLTNSVNHLITVFMERSFADILARSKRRVAWLRGSKRRPVDEQAKAVKSHAPTVSYSSEDGDTVHDMVHSLRRGDIVITHGLHRLGSSVSELREVLAGIRDAGAQVADIEASVLFDTDSVLLLAEAERIINGERRGAGHGLAMKRRVNGGGRRRADGSYTEAEALKVWRDPDVTTNAAAARITGWSVESLTRKFGGSGRRMGRPVRPKR